MKQVHRGSDMSTYWKGCIRVMMLAVMAICMLRASVISRAANFVMEDGGILGSKAISMEVESGYIDILRLGRGISFYITLEANESDFTGAVILNVPDAKGDMTAYSKEISLKKGEPAKVVFSLEVTNPWKAYVVQVQNKYNEVILSQHREVIVNTDMETCYIGVLSDNRGWSEYIQDEKAYVMNLVLSEMHDDINDWNMFDEIIIDQYDMKQMTDAQFRLLMEWVKQGGTLVLGTGEHYDEIMPRFEKEGILEVKEQGSFPYYTSLGLTPAEMNSLSRENSSSYEISQEYGNQRLKLTISKFRVKNSIVIRKEAEPLLESLRYGAGRLLIYHIALDGSKLQNHVLSVDITRTLLKELSTQRQEILLDHLYNSNVDGECMSVLKESSDVKPKSIAGYIILIIIYIIVVGPLLYFILSRWKKTSYYWWAVPACMILFFCAIYADGRNSRITRMRSNFFSVMIMGDKTINEMSVFNLTVPYKDEFSMDFGPGTAVQAINDRDYKYYLDVDEPDWKRPLRYTRKIHETGDGLEVKISGLKPFTSRYFMANKSYPVEGDYKADFHFSEDGLEGTFENHLGFDLGPTYLVGCDSIASMGTIMDGMCVKLSPGEGVPILTPEFSLMVDYEKGCNQIQKEYGESCFEMASAVNLIVHKYLNGDRRKSCLVSFVKADYQDSIFSDLMKQSDGDGVEMIVIPVEIDGTENKQTFVADLGDDFDILAGWHEYAEMLRYFCDSVEIRYQLPEDDKVTALSYTDVLNCEFNQEYNIGFSGRVFLYNYLTKVYDPVFEEGRHQITHVDCYLNSDNQVIVKYTAQSDKAGCFMTIPYISYYKEED